MNGASPDALYVPLGQRPEATTLTVRDLLQRTLHGRIRIPEFQRPLRWTGDDVVKLFDSLWRGYPIGSLLFWRRPGRSGPEGVVRIGGHALSVPEVADAWWVVDGQQRITALAAALLELEHGRDRRWSVYFDPKRPGFVGHADAAPGCCPGAALGDMKRLNRWYREANIDDDAWERRGDQRSYRRASRRMPRSAFERQRVTFLPIRTAWRRGRVLSSCRLRRASAAANATAMTPPGLPVAHPQPSGSSSAGQRSRATPSQS